MKKLAGIAAQHMRNNVRRTPRLSELFLLACAVFTPVRAVTQTSAGAVIDDRMGPLPPLISEAMVESLKSRWGIDPSIAHANRAILASTLLSDSLVEFTDETRYPSLPVWVRSTASDPVLWNRTPTPGEWSGFSQFELRLVDEDSLPDLIEVQDFEGPVVYRIRSGSNPDSLLFLSEDLECRRPSFRDVTGDDDDDLIVWESYLFSPEECDSWGGILGDQEARFCKETFITEWPVVYSQMQPAPSSARGFYRSLAETYADQASRLQSILDTGGKSLTGYCGSEAVRAFRALANRASAIGAGGPSN